MSREFEEENKHLSVHHWVVYLKSNTKDIDTFFVDEISDEKIKLNDSFPPSHTLSTIPKLKKCSKLKSRSTQKNYHRHSPK